MKNKDVKKKINIPVEEVEKLQIVSMKPTVSERRQLYSEGFFHDVEGLRVEDSDDDFASHVVRRSPRIMMKHTALGCKSSSSRLNRTITEEGPLVIQLNDDSKTVSHRGAKVLQLPGEPDVNVFDNIHIKSGPPVNRKPSDVHKKQSTENNSIPSAMKPCCLDKESIRQRLSDIFVKHEKVVADHFILKM
ncbi:Uncharacterized protein Adt_06407 [Abeliophyllum distichum]|uniref:Uncharacterized protein n=1 Tax=Abeliophyllum distichum TaxID=126358 RepID=A0ABD1V6T9_9LAMI